MPERQEERLQEEHARHLRRQRARTIRRIVFWSMCAIVVLTVLVAKKVWPKIQQGLQHRAVLVSTKLEKKESATDKGLRLMQLVHQQLHNNKPQEAIKLLQQVVRLIPDHAPAHLHLAMLLGDQGQTTEAMEHYRAVLRYNPTDPIALNNLADILATDPDEKVRDGQLALALASRACEAVENQSPILLSTLAAAYAETGQYAKAAEVARRAIESAKQQQLPQVAELVQLQLDHYQREVPLRKRLNVQVAISYAGNTSFSQDSNARRKERRPLSPLEEQLQSRPQ